MSGFHAAVQAYEIKTGCVGHLEPMSKSSLPHSCSAQYVFQMHEWHACRARMLNTIKGNQAKGKQHTI